MAKSIGVAAETLDSLKLLQDRNRPTAFHGWRASVAGRLGKEARPLIALLPAQGPEFDLASLAGNTTCMEEALENVLRAPRSQMRAELEPLALDPTHRSWVQSLADGSIEARRQLTHALEACHRVTIAPNWARANSHLDAVRANHAHTLVDCGVEELLKTLCPPLVRWRPPVLEVRHPRERDVHLQGRGLVIALTVFSWQQSEILQDSRDSSAAPVLAVPTMRDPAAGAELWKAGTLFSRSLGELLGHTRAAALRAAADGCTTTQLARRLGVTPAAASQQATVLRNASLITTTRRGKAVLHTITPLGAELLARA
ncbi:helix-turn-helix domain-containing protein [Streptomyces globisporus]|nr:helix-turn-helix domain-containing protein [Streptomyces globisporus]